MFVGSWYGFNLWLESRERGDYVLVAIPAADALNGRDGLAVSGVSFEAAMPINTLGMALDRNELASVVRQTEKGITSLTERLRASVRAQLDEKWPYQKMLAPYFSATLNSAPVSPHCPDVMGFRFRFE